MYNLTVGDRVVYEGVQEARVGQEAELLAFEGLDGVVLLFDVADAEGNRVFSTNTGDLSQSASRTTLEMPLLGCAFIDDGRPTDVDIGLEIHSD